MWEKIFATAAESGIWAILFVVLFFIQIKDSKTREQNYQSTIDALAEKLKMITDIKTDIEEIKNKIMGRQSETQRPNSEDKSVTSE